MTANLVAPARPWRVSRSVTTDAAVVLALTAALTHAIGTPEHVSSWLASGIFFAVLAFAQGMLAGVLFTGLRTPRLLLAGVWGHVAVIALYVWSRTAGLPFAPPVYGHGGHKGGPGRSIVPGAVEKVRLAEGDAPTAIQIYGADPEGLEEAASIAEPNRSASTTAPPLLFVW